MYWAPSAEMVDGKFVTVNLFVVAVLSHDLFGVVLALERFAACTSQSFYFFADLMLYCHEFHCRYTFCSVGHSSHCYCFPSPHLSTQFLIVCLSFVCC